MEQVLRQLDELRTPSWANAGHWADILIVTFLIYRLLVLIKGTQAWRITFGLLSFVVLLLVSAFLHLDTLSWILEKATLLGPVALVILLLPELRQALESIGKFWPQRLLETEVRMEMRTIEEIVAAVSELANARIGAIIVLEREGRLDSQISNGVMLRAQVSSALIGSIFYEGNPLHDGAAIIRGESIVAAACRLPLSESTRLDKNVHMRHRAAVGVTEGVDCVAIVVSEERGTISTAIGGKLRRLSNHMELRDILSHEFRGEVRRSRRPRPAATARSADPVLEPAAEIEAEPESEVIL